jgi:hypothetical protein
MDDMRLNRGDAIATDKVEREEPCRIIRSRQISPNHPDTNYSDIGGFQLFGKFTTNP